jgi:hypothetical protein
MKAVCRNTRRGRIAASILAVALLLLNAVESRTQTRIQIPKGRTSTTISRIIPASSDDFLEWIFLVRAKKGQTMTVTLRSNNGKVYFTGTKEKRVRRYLKETGDQSIAIINDGKATRFWMTISIR